MELRPPWATTRTIPHPRLAALDARVCLVECYDGRFARVFGPYPRAQAVRRRERWNRRARDMWRYEVWEDFDSTSARLAQVEPFFEEGEQWRYLAGHIAYETAPTYVVRVQPARRGPARIVETLFGPVPRKIANHATCARVGVLDWIADRAAESVFAQPPPATGDGVCCVWTVEWRLGEVGGEGGAQSCALPPSAHWPPGLDAEPELLRAGEG